MAPPRSGLYRGKRVRLLVVDDDPTLWRMFVRVLGPTREVSAASDPRTAIAAIDAGERFHIIFCDMVMLSLSGVDVYDRVERIDPRQARRIVFLTGSAPVPEASEFLERTGNVHLQKPIVPATLRSLVRRILGDYAGGAGS